jgi:N-acetylmuramoyl-L-alanine amidase
MMKALSALLFLFASLAILPAQTLSKNLDRIKLSGSDYVRLKEWSDSIGFKASWLKKDEELQVTNKSWRFRFTVNSIKSQINGLDVRLSLPVLARNGVVFISVVDIETTIYPLVYEPKASAKNKINVICLDPGHGGKDTGKIDRRHYEKTYTLLLAQEVGRLLKQSNFKVIYTRTRDEFVDLAQRPAVANRYGADLFISLHYNAADSRSVEGVETYCMTPAGVDSSNSGGGKSSTGSYTGNAHDEENMLLAYCLQRSVLKGFPAEDRGVKRARFQVLVTAKMPAALIEAGFMTNAEDAKKIYDPNYRKKMAQAIVDGILTYKRAVEN